MAACLWVCSNLIADPRGRPSNYLHRSDVEAGSSHSSSDGVEESAFNLSVARQVCNSCFQSPTPTTFELGLRSHTPPPPHPGVVFPPLFTICVCLLVKVSASLYAHASEPEILRSHHEGSLLTWTRRHNTWTIGWGFPLGEAFQPAFYFKLKVMNLLLSPHRGFMSASTERMTPIRQRFPLMAGSGHNDNCLVENRRCCCPSEQDNGLQGETKQ